MSEIVVRTNWQEGGSREISSSLVSTLPSHSHSHASQHSLLTHFLGVSTLYLSRALYLGLNLVYYIKPAAIYSTKSRDLIMSG